MPKYPGVYIEEIPREAKLIEGVGTSTAAFIGAVAARRVVASVQLVTSWHDYRNHYGDIQSSDDVMAISVRGFFENGGKQAYICNPDGIAVSGDTYSDIVTKLLDLADDASVIVMPGNCWSDHNNGIEKIKAVLNYCETAKRCIVIIDLPDNQLTNSADVQALGLSDSSYGVVYYPWIEVPAPKSRIRGQRALPRTRISPSGHVAGVWARMDESRGVWKAPAGTNVQLRGKFRLTFDIEDADQDQLNPHGINCLRKLPSSGHVVWGSRTLATRVDPEWRYVPVRRTAIMIEQSIYNGIQWAVFEPNDEPLWSQIRLNLGAFMQNLFRQGAFQGSSPRQAYFVKCDKETTTQNDIDLGIVNILVGFAPLKPAEFVVIKLQQIVGQV